MKDETTYIRKDKTRFIRTRVWFEYGLEKPLHEFIADLEHILISIPLEFRSEAIFEQDTGYDCSGGIAIYYDRDAP